MVEHLIDSINLPVAVRSTVAIVLTIVALLKVLGKWWLPELVRYRLAVRPEQLGATTTQDVVRMDELAQSRTELAGEIEPPAA